MFNIRYRRLNLFLFLFNKALVYTENKRTKIFNKIASRRWRLQKRIFTVQI